MTSRLLASLILTLLLICDKGKNVWSFSPPTPKLPSFALRMPALDYRMKQTHVSSSRLHVTRTTPPPETDKPIEQTEKHEKIWKRAYHLYVGYFNRLWNETEPHVRRKIATENAINTLKRVQHIMNGEEYVNLRRDKDTEEDIKQRQEARIQMLEACDTLLKTNESTSDENEGEPDKQVQEVEDSSASGKAPKKKKSRSVLFGATMGAVVALWVFSGNYIFTGLFTLMTILGQLEYYRMVMNTGIYPARRISVLGACSMFLSALFAPNLHQICLPIFGMISMIWFLTMRRQVSSISDIATTFTGMFYLGYIPSFWVRIRTLGSLEPTRLAPITKPMLEFLGTRAKSVLPDYLPKTVHLPITGGAIFIFWTWLSIAFSDVGAYFVGRKFGKTKLGKIAPAAGLTSPNKTVEGFLGGCLVSGMLATLGAWVQKWPYWYLIGPLHGAILGFLGLVGDLTASMLKRDAGLKDFGDLIPEHGGIMDRVDSFVFTAPYSWMMCQYIIPALRSLYSARTAIPII